MNDGLSLPDRRPTMHDFTTRARLERYLDVYRRREFLNGLPEDYRMTCVAYNGKVAPEHPTDEPQFQP